MNTKTFWLKKDGYKIKYARLTKAAAECEEAHLSSKERSAEIKKDKKASSSRKVDEKPPPKQKGTSAPSQMPEHDKAVVSASSATVFRLLPSSGSEASMPHLSGNETVAKSLIGRKVLGEVTPKPNPLKLIYPNPDPNSTLASLAQQFRWSPTRRTTSRRSCRCLLRRRRCQRAGAPTWTTTTLWARASLSTTTHSPALRSLSFHTLPPK